MSDETPVGIDLGTTFSCIGIWRNNQVEIIANSEDMKRLIGNKNATECIKRSEKYWTFKINENSEVEVNLDGETKRIKPEEVSSQILKKLKTSAEDVVRKPIKNIVLTVPAYFDENQKKATTKAAEMAGLNVLEMISEPSAAAYAYGFDQEKLSDTNLLVFDLGGGTLDVVIVKVIDGIFNVVAIGGDTQLGGRDFDHALMDYFLDIIENKYKKKISGNVKVMQRLLKECIELKLMLSAMEETNLFLGDLFPDIDEDINISRSTFNKICFNLFHRIETVIQGTFKEANMKENDIDKIILVGGSSRIPEIRELLMRIFPDKKLNDSLNPDEAIAYGATLRATQISKKGVTNIILNEVNAKRLKNTNSVHKINSLESVAFNTTLKATHTTKESKPTNLNGSNDKHFKITTNNGSASLISAIEENNIDRVRLLLEQGENPNALDESNQTALHFAALNKNDNSLIVELLLDYGVDIEKQSLMGFTCLMSAVCNDNFKIVKFLLEKGADPNRNDYMGKTALHYAISNQLDNTLVVELLLKHGADIEIANLNGWTSLMFTVFYEKINIVRCLLEKGADPNRKSILNTTALHFAARNRNDKTLFVELLLKHGADIEIQNNYGCTSLMEAVYNNNIKIVRYLLEQGADPNKTNKEGTTALYIARNKHNVHKEIIELLSKYDKKRKSNWFDF